MASLDRENSPQRCQLQATRLKSPKPPSDPLNPRSHHAVGPPAVTGAHDGSGRSSPTELSSETPEIATYETQMSGQLQIPDPLHAGRSPEHSQLQSMPNEVLLNIMAFLDVDDLISASRTNHRMRHVSLAPILHFYRLQHTRAILPPLLESRPSVDNLIARSIFITQTSVVSRRLGRSLVSIRLARRLASRPSPQELVNRAVLPPECIPGRTHCHVAPALVARRRAVEKEKVKDGLRHWIDGVWKGKVMQREEGVRQWEQTRGVGRVWRLRRFWERISRGEDIPSRHAAS